MHVNEAEPDLSRISEGRLDRLFAGAHLQVVDADEGMAEAVMDLRLGRELWRPTLGLALLLLVVELLVVRTTQTSRKEASPESRLRSRSG